MAAAPQPRSIRQKYGEELRIRRMAAGLTQEAVSEGVVCSPTLISHFEAGRRLPNPDDAQRLDRVLGTDGFFARWLRDLDPKYASHFARVAEFEQQAREMRHYGASLIPGLLQTAAYAREVLSAHTALDPTAPVDEHVVSRMQRAPIITESTDTVFWVLLDEAALRRKIGGPQVMAEQLHKVADLAEAQRIRLHVLPFGVGAHALLAGMLYLMSFDEAPSIAYVEGVGTGHVFDDPAMVNHCHLAYDLALGDALPHKESLALIRAVAKEYEREQ
ncbi:helix-turn-helix transcriptional regulator [Streptomyces sp. NBC_01387]|uniref:helix-turn-helix domain-containing protein n=1 Tax=unclassified Streptomyces TaxID=2593676 RepID=UPI002DDC713B|nr:MULTISPECIES: helix-turn-helix transcriptional regulator [unclassified Streptomyces]WSC21881.1 helix-turn-helix transcriptional regulator [Streptomyces sp. NBC_01766]WSV55836.1 helix-turn-helix transcriptional regulator [Streptomyces sp. NBC_01014]